MFRLAASARVDSSTWGRRRHAGPRGDVRAELLDENARRRSASQTHDCAVAIRDFAQRRAAAARLASSMKLDSLQRVALSRALALHRYGAARFPGRAARRNGTGGARPRPSHDLIRPAGSASRFSPFATVERDHRKRARPCRRASALALCPDVRIRFLSGVARRRPPASDWSAAPLARPEPVDVTRRARQAAARLARAPSSSTPAATCRTGASSSARSGSTHVRFDCCRTSWRSPS